MTPEALNLYHHRELELSGSSLGRDKGLEAMRIQFQVLHQGVLGRTNLLHDVGPCLQKFGAARSISICRRSELIPEISFISSSRPFISPRIATSSAYRLIVARCRSHRSRRTPPLASGSSTGKGRAVVRLLAAQAPGEIQRSPIIPTPRIGCHVAVHRVDQISQLGLGCGHCLHLCHDCFQVLLCAPRRFHHDDKGDRLDVPGAAQRPQAFGRRGRPRHTALAARNRLGGLHRAAFWRSLGFPNLVLAGAARPTSADCTLKRSGSGKP